MVTTTVNATMPISGLGNPNTDACGVTMIDPQDSTGFRLHDGTNVGSISSSIFSTVRVKAEARPASPAMMIHSALGRPAPVGPARRISPACAGSSPASDSVLTVMKPRAPARAASRPGTFPTISLTLATSASGVL